MVLLLAYLCLQLLIALKCFWLLLFQAVQRPHCTGQMLSEQDEEPKTWARRPEPSAILLPRQGQTSTALQLMGIYHEKGCETKTLFFVFHACSQNLVFHTGGSIAPDFREGKLLWQSRKRRKLCSLKDINFLSATSVSSKWIYHLGFNSNSTNCCTL